MFIAYFMAFVLSCETICSIRVLGIVYKFFSADIIVLCVLPRAPANEYQKWVHFPSPSFDVLN
jgi:hypothetical protein